MPFFGSSWGENWYADEEKERNHYFMYGISIPYSQYKSWEDGTGRSFPLGTYGDIFCFFNGRDGKHVIVGRKIKVKYYRENAIRIPELTETEENQIRESVKDKFGFEGEFHYYYIIE